MAAFNKFNCFVEDLGLKKHNLDTDTIKVYLTNTQPVATNTVYNTPADLGTGGGYTAGGEDMTCVWSQSSGTATLSGTDVVWTANGAVGPFQYAVAYNFTAAAKNLICWWERTTPVTMASGDTFTWDTGASILTLA